MYSPIQHYPVNENCYFYNSDERVTFSQLVLIKYDDHGKQRVLRIRNEIAPEWKSLAALLDFKESSITTIEAAAHYQPQEATDKMLREWMAKDWDCTWRKLIRKMDDAGLRVPARDLANALCHIIDDDE